jgi:hypothetical protein
MLGFNPILQQRDVMYKFAFPLSERMPLLSENIPIENQPKIPAGSD